MQISEMGLMSIQLLGERSLCQISFRSFYYIFLRGKPNCWIFPLSANPEVYVWDSEEATEVTRFFPDASGDGS